MANDQIIVSGAREHNLQSVDVKIPKNKLVVLTGLSGVARARWRLTRCMQKGREDMWRV